jgi:hypothetical protein
VTCRNTWPESQSGPRVDKSLFTDKLRLRPRENSEKFLFIFEPFLATKFSVVSVAPDESSLDKNQYKDEDAMKDISPKTPSKLMSPISTRNQPLYSLKTDECDNMMVVVNI